MEDLKNQLEDLKVRFAQIKTKLDPEVRARQIRELEAKTLHEGFWSDTQEAQSVMKRLSALRDEDENLNSLESELSDAIGLTDVLDNPSELEVHVKKLSKKLSQLEIRTFLNGKYDNSNVILTIHAGQGGVEAMDWASMLFRMYLQFCQSRGWGVEIVDQTPGEEAGLKTVVLQVSGPYAYGNLAGERVTHSLVRLSPFNADNLRQTSFALVEVLPELPEEDDEIVIPEDEVQFEAFRATGHGGQNVNKVSTAVRLTHIPTGISVACQTQRFQEQNRKLAMNMLKAKLWAKREEERAAHEKQLKGKYTAASWGTQIRSYVLHPYKLVKDLRTNVETSQAESVLDGNLDMFIEAEVRLLAGS